MGLDMMIFKMKKFENATLNDVFAVDSYLRLQEYKKDHPTYRCSMMKWCGQPMPRRKLINFYKDHPAQEVAYWRKANMVHKWFVDHIQNGKDDCDVHRPVTKADLEELRRLCIAVMDNPGDAVSILPVQSGFFFGGTTYDKYYMEKIEYTVVQIDELLADTDFETEELYYVSSW